jgi:hypothetical protein
MNSPAAFRGTYADWKLVKTRAVVQIVFEVPLEDSDAAYEILGGMPNHANERWFGIAALTPPATESVIDPPTAKTPERLERLHAIKAGGDSMLRAPVLAYLREEHAATPCANTDDAAAFVRAYCRVNSRAHFNSNPAAKAVWQSLDTQYQAWKAAHQ